MKILIVGGLGRLEGSLRDIAERAGHDFEMHEGHVGGTGTDEIRRCVDRADLVVVLTDVNSHGAVGVARRASRESGRPVLLARRLGPSRFRTLVEALAQRSERDARPAREIAADVIALAS